MELLLNMKFQFYGTVTLWLWIEGEECRAKLHDRSSAQGKVIAWGEVECVAIVPEIIVVDGEYLGRGALDQTQEEKQYKEEK